MFRLGADGRVRHGRVVAAEPTCLSFPHLRPAPVTTLVWLRHDLRLDDHALFAAAARDAHLVPVYVFDPAAYGDSGYGFPRVGAHHARTLLDALADLRASLRRVGSDLVVRIGAWDAVVVGLARETGAARVLVHAEPMREEADAEAAVERALAALGETTGVRLERHPGHTLLHPDDLPFAIADLPEVFTAFRKAVERGVPVRPPLPAPPALPPLPPGLDPGPLPTLADLGVAPLDDRRPDWLRGGETNARARLDRYVWRDRHLRTYKETRNGLLGDGVSAKLSAFLAHGSLSPRRVADEVRRYETTVERNDSTYWLVFELLWRDYFRFWGAKHGDRLFFSGGPTHGRLDWEWDDEAFDAWREGRTGIPFVDAAMRELRATGYTSNRMRQNVGSLLTKNLRLDWRAGAAWFEAMLGDHDVTSNWGNWAYVGGVGADPRDRYFNLTTQAERYDADGAFVRTWVPELAALPPGLAREPWRLTPMEQAAYGVRIGTDYPAPIVDLDATYPRPAGPAGRPARDRKPDRRNPDDGRARRGTTRR